MNRSAVTIAGILLLLAAVYVVFWTPGAPESQSTSHAINRTE
jgi:type II secretory pathway component PulM